MISTIAASAARSTSLTKSFGPLAVTVSRSRSRAPRLMMLPARRAALTASVSMGCMSANLGLRPAMTRTRRVALTAERSMPRILPASFDLPCRTPLDRIRDRPVRDQPSRQYRRDRARDADDGLVAARAGRSRNAFRDPDAEALAAGATRVLAAARVEATLDEALAGAVLAIGFSARPREFAGNVLPCAPPRTRRCATPPRATSRWCSATRCRDCPTPSSRAARSSRPFPSNPDFASLNLAAAVQVAAYELHVAAHGGDGVARARVRARDAGRDRAACSRTANVL